MPNTFTFRPGGATDIEAVRELCQDVWGGHDYLPYVWVEWTQDPTNQLFVLENEGAMAGFYCLSLQIGQTHRMGWIKGVRVATTFKRQGLAGQMLAHALAQSRAHSLDRVRYGTNETNIPMHTLADRYGFKLLANYSYLLAPLLEPTTSKLPTPTARLLQPAELEAAWSFIHAAPSWRTGHGLQCVHWNWQDLGKSELANLLAQAQVWSYFDGGTIAALAFAYPVEDEPLFVGWLDGETQAVKLLAQYLQLRVSSNKNKASLQKHALELMLVSEDSRDKVLQEMGFELDPNDYMRVYEAIID